jgi:hypothetical protein
MLMLFQKHFAFLIHSNNTIRCIHNHLYTHYGEGIWRSIMTNTRNAKAITASVSLLDATTQVVSITNLPTSLADMANYIEMSKNDKTLPAGEIRLEFEVTLQDGTITTFGGTCPLWLNKEHVKASVKAQEAEKQAIKDKEIQLAKEEAMASLSPELLQKLLDLGMLK